MCILEQIMHMCFEIFFGSRYTPLFAFHVTENHTTLYDHIRHQNTKRKTRGVRYKSFDAKECAGRKSLLRRLLCIFGERADKVCRKQVLRCCRRGGRGSSGWQIHVASRVVGGGLLGNVLQERCQLIIVSVNSAFPGISRWFVALRRILSFENVCWQRRAWGFWRGRRFRHHHRRRRDRPEEFFWCFELRRQRGLAAEGRGEGEVSRIVKHAVQIAQKLVS